MDFLFVNINSWISFEVFYLEDYSFILVFVKKKVIRFKEKIIECMRMFIMFMVV